MTVYCECCGTKTTTHYQPRERLVVGEWTDEGGFYITTCFNKSCAMYGATLETSRHKDRAKQARNEKESA